VFLLAVSTAESGSVLHPLLLDVRGFSSTCPQRFEAQHVSSSPQKDRRVSTRTLGENKSSTEEGCVVGNCSSNGRAKPFSATPGHLTGVTMRLMKRTRFGPGQEPKVLTSISEECKGGMCESCPGIFEQDEYPDESIFCVHDCHRKRNQDGE